MRYRIPFLLFIERIMYAFWKIGFYVKYFCNKEYRERMDELDKRYED